jgi:hypothetical protein
VIGDFFRFWGALIGLNARKAVFRARRGGGRCPCQSPSDSGRAWKTRCEAAASWDKPERLRYVCPHLRRNAEGWICSVDTTDVRPFWGRALACLGGAALFLYVVGAVGAFAFLRSQEHLRISILDTLLPHRWENIVAARSDYFLQRARQAMLRNDHRTVRVNLESAAATATDRYEVRLAIAQVYSYLPPGEPAERLFENLQRDFPAQHQRTAVALHDVLVALGRFEALGDLAAAELARNSAESATWLRPLFVALRGSRRPAEVLARNAQHLAAMPASWRNLIEAEAALRAGSGTALRQLFGLPASSVEPALLVLAGESIAEFAAPAEAVDEILRLAPALGAFERDRLLFLTYAEHGLTASASRMFDALLRDASQPAKRDRLLATLVAYPDAARLQRIGAAVSNPRTPFTVHELAAVWVAAVSTGDPELRALTERRLHAHFALEISPTFPTAPVASSATVWMRTLPLQREVAWSVALHFSRAVTMKRRAGPG